MPSSHRLDRRSPLVVEIHDLARRPGTMRELHREVPAPEGMGVDMIAVPEGSPIALDLRLESAMEGVLVTGCADVQLHAECARCLRAFDYDDTFDLQELFFYPGREADEDARWVVDELIDLEDVLRDAVVLELPFTPLCRDDCAGLCLTCGVNLNDQPEHGHDGEFDPRWAGLVGLAGTEEPNTTL
ncbi:MAG: YceD family protein [Propionibacteriaceae bacterium]|nr:YceD family protein [Propionibacteriaceae bacterium]